MSCASRLNVIGPLDGARIQVELVRYIEGMLTDRSNDRTVPKQVSPILEFVQSRHDVLYSRLFNS